MAPPVVDLLAGLQEIETPELEKGLSSLSSKSTTVCFREQRDPKSKDRESKPRDRRSRSRDRRSRSKHRKSRSRDRRSRSRDRRSRSRDRKSRSKDRRSRSKDRKSRHRSRSRDKSRDRRDRSRLVFFWGFSPYQLLSNNLVVTIPDFFNCRSREKKKEKKRDRSRSRDRHHKKHKKERQVFIKLQCSSDFHVLYFAGHERGEDQHRDPGLEKASRRVKMTTTVRN